MRNLLEETLLDLKRHNLGPEDVCYVKNDITSTDWYHFSICAAKYDYDAGFGGQEVNEDLKVVGKDWWLERHEYDGSEWWEYKKLPINDKPYSDSISLCDIWDRE